MAENGVKFVTTSAGDPTKFTGALKDAGATPDLVQVGNEITSGMLMHICGATGNVTSVNPINGSASNWENLGTLLKAGIAGVKEVDHLPELTARLHWIHLRDQKRIVRR